VNPVHQIFGATWYTYARGAVTDSKRQRWYTIQAPFAPGSRVISNAPIYETIGGTFNSANPAVTTTSVGTSTITFHSCLSATVSYSFPNRPEASGALNLTREVAPDGCSP
jgi:hypothetical protein